MGLGSVGIVLPSSGQPTDPCEGIFITAEAAACGFHHSQGEVQGCTGIARAVVWSNMFRNTFQSGFLSILYSLGSKPLEIWQGEGKRGAHFGVHVYHRRAGWCFNRVFCPSCDEPSRWAGNSSSDHI